RQILDGAAIRHQPPQRQHLYCEGFDTDLLALQAHADDEEQQRFYRSGKEHWLVVELHRENQRQEG
ncbi:MAG TPA: hypothetical protein PKM88_08870, partial [bacterium]|nr:hypothetical protein [bacterium]